MVKYILCYHYPLLCSPGGIFVCRWLRGCRDQWWTKAPYFSSSPTSTKVGRSPDSHVIHVCPLLECLRVQCRCVCVYVNIHVHVLHVTIHHLRGPGIGSSQFLFTLHGLEVISVSCRTTTQLSGRGGSQSDRTPFHDVQRGPEV